MVRSVSDIYEEMEDKKKKRKEKIYATLGILIGVPIILIKVLSFFGFDASLNFEIVEKVKISKSEHRDFSPEGMNSLLSSYYNKLAEENWLPNIAGRISLTESEIQECIHTRFYLMDEESQSNDEMTIEFTCELEGRVEEDAKLVVKELKNQFEAFIKS